MADSINTYTPRENLRRTLTYRPHIKWIYYGLQFAAAFFLLYFSYLTYGFYSYGSQQEALLILAAGLIFPALFFVQALFYIRPMAFSVVHVQPDKVSLEILGKKSEINFTDIQSVKFAHVPYVGGWFEILLNNKAKFRFTVALERSEYILESVASFKPDLFPHESFMQYRKAAILSDHSWARIQDDFKKWQPKLIKFFLAPILFTLIMNTTNGSTLFTSIEYVLVFNSLFILIISIIFDLVTTEAGSKRLDSNPQSAIRDMDFENKMRLREEKSYWFFFITSILVFFILHFT